jgi:hypothetical protein
MRQLARRVLACGLPLALAATWAVDAGAAGDDRWEVAIDWVTSVVHVPITTVAPAATPGGASTRKVEDARVVVRNFAASASYRFARHWTVGLMVPWTSSTITVGDTTTRSTTSFGNAELTLWFDHAPFAYTTLAYGLGFSGASAQGDTTEPETQKSSDKEATNRAVTASGGRLENARYSPGHYAVILTIALAYHRRGWQLEPYLRIEDLRDTSAEAEQRDLFNNELGVRIAHAFGRFDLGVRAFVDWVPARSTTTDRKASATVEPEVRAHFGPLTVLAGVIVPVTRPETGPRIVAFELALILRF